MKHLQLITLLALLLWASPGVILANSPTPPTDTKIEMESTNYAITWSALEETHGGPTASDNFQMINASVGQALAQDENTGGLCTGFICIPTTKHHIFLPLVLRL
jgi:hypothetical protein